MLLKWFVLCKINCFSNLFDILLEEPEGEPLMQLDLLGVPLGLELPVVGQDVVDDGEHVVGALRVVARRVLRQRPRVLQQQQR